MITYKKGNLLTAKAEALVNTVNTVGVMGKGIALMFKEQFPENMVNYKNACRLKLINTGKIFVTEQSMAEPRWIINFPTKQHWKNPSKMDWIIDGLNDLHQFIKINKIKSIAIPPLGAGNGGLSWQAVRKQIESILSDLVDVDILVYEPTQEYQNITKSSGAQKLTPARALIAELIRRYWLLGVECSLLEAQKLAWFLERSLKLFNVDSPLKFKFKPHIYGPYADELRHLLITLNGHYLCCEKKINDARPFDSIWFNSAQKESLQEYLASNEMRPYTYALEYTSKLIDGFESPFGMELLATVDWLIEQDKCEPNTDSLLEGLNRWKNNTAAKRKIRLFNKEAISIALKKLQFMKNANQTPS